MDIRENSDAQSGTAPYSRTYVIVEFPLELTNHINFNGFALRKINVRFSPKASILYIFSW